MFDAFLRQRIDPISSQFGVSVARVVSANQVSYIGFGLGLLSGVSIAFGFFRVAGLLFLLNRLCDALDGAVARATKLSDYGGFLDIVLDFMVYSCIPLAFAIRDSNNNGLVTCILLFSMIGSMSTFLAHAILAVKNRISTNARGEKSFFYMGGVAEGFETMVILSSMCFYPEFYFHLAVLFSVLCILTTLGRILNARSIAIFHGE